jgi:hypothetical protein
METPMEVVNQDEFVEVYEQADSGKSFLYSEIISPDISVRFVYQ